MSGWPWRAVIEYGSRRAARANTVWDHVIGQAVPGHLRLRGARARRPLLGRDAGLPGRVRRRAGRGRRALDPTGAGPRLYFQRVPEGKVVKNRLHLDIRVGTGLVGDERVAVLEEECSRLVALGATRVRLLVADEENESCLVMQDVEGNEFCLA